MADLNSCTILYKVLSQNDFNALLAVAPSTPLTDPSSSSLSVCTSARLPYVLESLFATSTDLWVLAIPRSERIDPLLRWQDAEGCGQVEGGVDPWGEIALRRPVKRSADGPWDLGELEW
jgi:hypothetical protein